MILSSSILPFWGLNLPKSWRVWKFLVIKWTFKVGEWQSGSTLLAAFCLLSLDYDLGNALSHSYFFSARISLWGCASPWCTREPLLDGSVPWNQANLQLKTREYRRFKVTLLCLLRAVWSMELLQKPGDSTCEMCLLWDWKYHLDRVIYMGKGNCAAGLLQFIPFERIHWNGFRKGRVKRKNKSLRGNTFFLGVF